MKIRILGTSINTYIKNINKLINANIKEFLYVDEGIKSWFVDSKTKNKIIEFTSHVTGRQNIEAFEAFGFIKNIVGRSKILIKNSNEIKESYKKSIIKNHPSEKIQNLRNTKLLALSDAYSKIGTNDLIIFNIEQTRGKVSLAKIRKSINKYERALLNEDPTWIIRIRKAFYEQLDKEL